MDDGEWMARGSKPMDKTRPDSKGQDSTGQDRKDSTKGISFCKLTSRMQRNEREREREREEANRFPVSSFHLTSTVLDREMYCNPSRMARPLPHPPPRAPPPIQSNASFHPLLAQGLDCSFRLCIPPLSSFPLIPIPLFCEFVVDLDRFFFLIDGISF